MEVHDVASEAEAASSAPAPAAKEGAAASTSSFQAETTQLLDIVTNSLYTDKEVFLRELISNASDAIEKARHLQVTGAAMADAEKELAIRIETDEAAGTITIQDAGCGMTVKDLHDNLGTIARSGTKQFAKAAQASASQDARANLIGQFGVGFYASFMVADTVEVFTKAHDPAEPAQLWRSTGVGSYDVVEAEGVERGTKIVLHLKDDCRAFSKASAVQQIIKKYSNFVNHPIYVDGDKVNTVQAIWVKGKDEVSDDEHNEFYKYIANAYDRPMYRLHFSADAPIDVKALFYVGQMHTEKMGMGKMDGGVNLYSRKILIDQKAELLPDWLRFVHGVVDSEDIPLNISREGMQDSTLIRRISKVLTKRFIKHLNDQSKADADAYLKFYDEYNQFIKEGVCTDFDNRDDISKLLRFESSKLPAGELTSLDEYINRSPPGQSSVYYLYAPDRRLAEESAYYEVFKKTDTEVLFMYMPIDDFVMTNVGEFNKRKVVSAESADVADLNALAEAEREKSAEPQNEESAEGGPKAEKPSDGSSRAPALSSDDRDGLQKWLREVALAEKVAEVNFTERLYDSPAIVVDHESGALRRMMIMVEHQQTRSGSERMSFLPKQVMEINPAHPIIVSLAAARHADPEMAQVVAEQLYDNCLVTAGLMDDSKRMLPRLQTLMEAAIAKK
jgi:HSP90 family molecular chaperone